MTTGIFNFVDPSTLLLPYQRTAPSRPSVLTNYHSPHYPFHSLYPFSSSFVVRGSFHFLPPPSRVLLTALSFFPASYLPTPTNLLQLSLLGHSFLSNIWSSSLLLSCKLMSTSIPRSHYRSNFPFTLTTFSLMTRFFLFF